MAEKPTDLTDMKRDPRARSPMAEREEEDDYGYGLCLRLENFELDKLKLAMPQVGKEFTIRAVGKVTSVHECKSEGNEQGDRAVMIQITALSLR